MKKTRRKPAGELNANGNWKKKNEEIIYPKNNYIYSLNMTIILYML